MSNNDNIDNSVKLLNYLENINNENKIDFSKPFRVNDENCNNIYDKWVKKFQDEWVNNVASINTNNSLSQYNNFLIKRLSYAESASLASDSIIHNAITKYCNEVFRKGGEIIINLENKELENEAKVYIENRLKELEFFDKLKEAMFTSLIYGGAFLFIDVNSEDLSKELIIRKEVFQNNKINGFVVVTPDLCAPASVNSYNPLSYDYMKPSLWNIGGNIINSNRLVKLVIFDIPLLLKPLYNYFGVSLCQFMRPYVASADVARQALSDIFLRFKTDVIQTDLIKVNPQEAVARAKAINKTRNNLSLLLLSNDENFVQTITSLSGLDKIVAQLLENVAVSARMPSVKLLGLTPSGFNSTGDFDLNSYYDEIMSLQNAIIKPIIEKVLHLLSLELGLDIYPEYNFELLEKNTKLEKGQIDNLQADLVSKLIQAGIITQEQGFQILQKNGIFDNKMKFEEDEGDIFNFDNNEENNQ